VAHAAVRRILGRATSRRPDSLRYLRGPFGRPFVAGLGLDFSLSRSGDLALLALSTGPRVGVDVEAVQPGIVEPALLLPYVTTDTVAALAAMSDVQRIDGFFRLWTRIEALSKARGTGIAAGPHPRLALGDMAPSTRALPDDGGDFHHWQWADLPAPEGYRAALAMAGELPPLVMHWFGAPMSNTRSGATSNAPG
jgi:4'-phosphopantetheinyl transferase